MPAGCVFHSIALVPGILGRGGPHWVLTAIACVNLFPGSAAIGGEVGEAPVGDEDVLTVERVDPEAKQGLGPAPVFIAAVAAPARVDILVEGGIEEACPSGCGVPEHTGTASVRGSSSCIQRIDIIFCHGEDHGIFRREGGVVDGPEQVPDTLGIVHLLDGLGYAIVIIAKGNTRVNISSIGAQRIEAQVIAFFS